jgi:predicted transcriptional regulator
MRFEEMPLPEDDGVPFNSWLVPARNNIQRQLLRLHACGASVTRIETCGDLLSFIDMSVGHRAIGVLLMRRQYGVENCDVIYYVSMTKLLEKAIEKVRELPAEDQDTVAVAVLSMTEETPVALDDENRVAIREGLEQARLGKFVPDEEIDALWKRHGL